MPRTGLSPALVALSRAVPLRQTLVTPAIKSSPVLQPQKDKSFWFGLFRVRSPLLTESLLLSFPRGNEMFQFPPFASCCYGFTAR